MEMTDAFPDAGNDQGDMRKQAEDPNMPSMYGFVGADEANADDIFSRL